MGFVYNIGRVTSAAGPYLIGRVSETGGMSAALHHVGRVSAGGGDCLRVEGAKW